MPHSPRTLQAAPFLLPMPLARKKAGTGRKNSCLRHRARLQSTLPWSQN